jgi:steroid 5-alpha reductase family enzyme
MTWTLQGLWVLLTLSCGLAAMTTAHPEPLGAVAGAGAALFLLGFTIEAVADHQKRRFRQDPAHEGRFITTGLWAWSRHPNYFGEIVLWTGIALVALPALDGWQHATLVSPVFVFVLLTRISGIPLLEARAEKRWGDDPEFRAYTERTPKLVPRPPR